jgi:cytochrome c oxidase subunit 2
VQKFWSIFFGLVLAATFGIWVVAPFAGWWLPENVASFGGDVDYLFYVILGFTGFFFVLTEAIMVYAMWRFAHRPGEKSEYTHGNHRLEVFWTAVPAAILLFIAFAQVRAWEHIKYQSRMPPPDLTLQVTARQWEWRMRYPYDVERFHYSDDADANTKQVAEGRARRWADNPEYDDLYVPNELHTWEGANVKLYLKTLDVLHSLYLPNLRLKQDALPGKTIPVWFKATDSNTFHDAAENQWVAGKDPRKSRALNEQIKDLRDQAAALLKKAEPVLKQADTKEAEREKLLRVKPPKKDAAEKLKKEIAALRAQAEPFENEAKQLRDEAYRAVHTPDRGFMWEISCAELCGGRHYAMRGRLFVHPSQEDFQKWLSHLVRQQRGRQPTAQEAE